jgi:hypothetical protein
LVFSVSKRYCSVSSTVVRESAVSNSAGGRSPSALCSRALLNQPRYSTTASSSWDRHAIADQLGLEAVDEALCQRVVVGIADRADAGEDAVVGEGLGVVDRGVLAAADALM